MNLIILKLSFQQSNMSRARHFPLPNDPGQVKLPAGKWICTDFFLFISYKQIEEFQNSLSRASDDIEKRQALMRLNLFAPSNFLLPRVTGLMGLSKALASAFN